MFLAYLNELLHCLSDLELFELVQVLQHENGDIGKQAHGLGTGQSLEQFSNYLVVLL